MLAEALEPLATNPELRNAILDVRKSYEQTIDEVSKDEVLFAGHFRTRPARRPRRWSRRSRSTSRSTRTRSGRSRCSTAARTRSG